MNLEKYMRLKADSVKWAVPGARCIHPSHGAGTIKYNFIDDSSEVEFDKVTGWDEKILRVTTSLLKPETIQERWLNNGNV